MQQYPWEIISGAEIAYFSTILLLLAFPSHVIITRTSSSFKLFFLGYPTLLLLKIINAILVLQDLHDYGFKNIEYVFMVLDNFVIGIIVILLSFCMRYIEGYDDEALIETRPGWRDFINYKIFKIEKILSLGVIINSFGICVSNRVWGKTLQLFGYSSLLMPLIHISGSLTKMSQMEVQFNNEDKFKLSILRTCSTMVPLIFVRLAYGFCRAAISEIRFYHAMPVHWAYYVILSALEESICAFLFAFIVCIIFNHEYQIPLRNKNNMLSRSTYSSSNSSNV